MKINMTLLSSKLRRQKTLTHKLLVYLHYYKRHCKKPQSVLKLANLKSVFISDQLKDDKKKTIVISSLYLLIVLGNKKRENQLFDCGSLEIKLTFWTILAMISWKKKTFCSVGDQNTSTLMKVK